MTTSSNNYKIDGRVIEAMLITAAAFLLLMAFRHKNTRPCRQVDFSFRTANKLDVAYEKERVYFSSELKYNASNWEWDFGDKTPPDTKSGPYAEHVYAQPGQYTVRLTVNGKCAGVREISIGRRSIEKPRLYLRPRWPPEVLEAGREYYFTDSTLGANKWTWYFGKDDSKRTKQSVSYQFTEPGDYAVTLIVNDDLEFGKEEKMFRVMPARRFTTPVPPVPAGGNGGGGLVRRPSTLPENPDPGGDNRPVSILDLANDKKKQEAVQKNMIGEAELKAYVLDINGSGAAKLKNYLKGQSYSNCNIVFNGRSLSLEQLKENMAEHARYGKSLSVKKETDPNDNSIKVLEITAELEMRDRLLAKPKARKYPH